MIEATCAACGTVNRIAEAEVPPGAKFVSCASCKSKVPVAAKVVPAPEATGDDIAAAFSRLDERLGAAVPAITDVYLDVTERNARTRDGTRPAGADAGGAIPEQEL